MDGRRVAVVSEGEVVDHPVDPVHGVATTLRVPRAQDFGQAVGRRRSSGSMHAPTRIAIALCLPLLLVACGGAGPGTRSTTPRPDGTRPSGASDGTLVAALEAWMTVRVRPDGERVYVRHCRDAPVDCRERIAALASILERKAREHDLDPWLLAAIAVRESGLNPAAVGAQGEAGIVQLHPRGAGHDVRYVHDEGYREECLARVDACQEPVVERGARYLADAIRRCGGVAAGLGRYASGRCNPGLRYVERVLEQRRRLRSGL